MKRIPTTLRLVLAAGATALALTACGGHDHDDNDDDVTSSVPGSASESVDGFIEYLMKLVVASADTLEPVDVSGVTPPLDETAEPRVLD